MIKEESKEYEDIIDYIKGYLKISSNYQDTSLKSLYEYYSLDIPLRPDAILEDHESIYFIEIKSKATIDTIARMNLLRDLMLQREYREKNISLIIAAKSFSEREKRIMNQLDIIMVKLPWSFKSTMNQQFSVKTTRITSDKSWKVVSRLLKETKTSIRQLSILEDISYGWAHKTIQTLIQQNIVKQDHNYVSISNVDKLLNGVAWERPLVNLKSHEISIPFDDSTYAAREITEAFALQDIPVGFTSYTAATLCTGYGVRNDTVYLYLKDEHVEYFKELFESSSPTNVKAMIYRPDRDVFQDTLEKEGIRIVSASQILLDLAGMGYSAMDITKQMVLIYDKI
ncbi:hypothetical protein [Methanolobus psychrotolerans]|uniref:hypothetical protein n=1 Tax=Methanolobus psychrotolerans TaxID=1874706 RepID=UPI000B918258|nr:hypothetical protein [Methanolobus psychrotolerans]